MSLIDIIRNESDISKKLELLDILCRKLTSDQITLLYLWEKNPIIVNTIMRLGWDKINLELYDVEESKYHLFEDFIVKTKTLIELKSKLKTKSDVLKKIEYDLWNIDIENDPFINMTRFFRDNLITRSQEKTQTDLNGHTMRTHISALIGAINLFDTLFFNDFNDSIGENIINFIKKNTDENENDDNINDIFTEIADTLYEYCPKFVGDTDNQYETIICTLKDAFTKEKINGQTYLHKLLCAYQKDFKQYKN